MFRLKASTSSDIMLMNGGISPGSSNPGIAPGSTNGASAGSVTAQETLGNGESDKGDKSSDRSDKKCHSRWRCSSGIFSKPSCRGEGTVLNDFCQNTSLHGWNLCFRDHKPFAHTLGWLIIILISMSSVGYLMFININEFSDATVSINLESPTVPLNEVYFPSVTLCNMNSMRKSFIKSLLHDEQLANVTYKELHRAIEKIFVQGQMAESSPSEQQLIQTVIRSQTYDRLFSELLQLRLREYPRHISETMVVYQYHNLRFGGISQENRLEYKRNYLLEVASQYRDREMMAQVKFRGYGIWLDNGFTTDLSETCVWLTPLVKKPSDITDLRTIQPGAKNGANNGLELLLDAETYDYASTSSASEGFALSITHQLDIPIMRQTGINIQPGQSIQISVSPTLVNTTQGARRRFSPRQRQCYFEDEIQLRHFPQEHGYRYQMTNCLYEATLQKIEQQCGCTPGYFYDVVEGYEACQGTGKRCMKDLIDSMGEERFIQDGTVLKECLVNCIDQTHAFLVTQAAYPNAQSFPHNPEFCVVLDKLIKGCNGDRRITLNEHYPELCHNIKEALNSSNNSAHFDCLEHQQQSLEYVESPYNPARDAILQRLHKSVAQYTRDNMAKLNIFIRDPYVKRYLTEEKISEISFVGNVGGLLGLFMGFSFISVAEILYFICFGGMWRKAKKRVGDSEQVE